MPTTKKREPRELEHPPSMTNDSINPYESPSADSGAPSGFADRRAFRYTELPRTCPLCGNKFSDVLYHRLYPRRYRWGTILFFILVSIGGFVLMGCFGWLTLFIVIPLLAWGMKWHKKVRVRCSSCKWEHTFIVSVRG